MTSPRGWAARASAAVAGAVMVGTLLAAIAPTPAAAITVVDEVTLRAAFANAGETQIDLAADITLATCPDGVVTRNSATNLIVNGHGHTVTQTCAMGDSGVFRQSGSGALTFENITVTGGHSDNGGAGIASGSSVSLSNSTVTGNTAVGASAGGVFSDTGVALTSSTVSGNSSTSSGGGIFSNGTVSLTNSSVSGNTGTVGGGIVTGSAAVSLTNSTVSDNTATASRGGGMLTSGTVSLTNSTLSNNTAGQFGGGVSAADVVLVYATVTSNTAATGANIEIRSTVTLTSFGSVVALPQGGGENCTFGPPPVTNSSGFNFSDDDSCLFNEGTDRQNAGDPGLGALANNGGPTQTRLPSSGSPLIDAIPTGSCQADGASGITTDQRGVSRPQGAGCDIGAVDVPFTAPVAAPAPAPVGVTPRFTG